MMKSTLLPIVALALLSSCGEGGTGGQARQDMVASPEAAPQAEPQADAEDSAEAALPQIAYTYSYRFRLPTDAVTKVQETHLDLCEKLGPARCRVVEMQRGASSGEYAHGSLKLQVAAPLARDFGTRLVATAGEAGGEAIDRAIQAEDLSKQMVDTDARVRTKEALVARLTNILETRSGNIEQAVAAERAVNTAQEELEQARAWLAEMRGRIAMSTIDIAYESGGPLGGGFSEPIRRAFANIGSFTGQSLSILITLMAGLLPWLFAGLVIFFGVRAARRRGWIGARNDPENDRP